MFVILYQQNMPRVRARKTERGLVQLEVYERAFLDISVRKISLRAYAMWLYSDIAGEDQGISHTNVFTVDQERKLQAYQEGSWYLFWPVSCRAGPEYSQHAPRNGSHSCLHTFTLKSGKIQLFYSLAAFNRMESWIGTQPVILNKYIFFLVFPARSILCLEHMTAWAYMEEAQAWACILGYAAWEIE